LSARRTERPAGLKVAAILDEMSTACFAPDCELIAFGTGDWESTLAERQPDLLLVESAWKGNGGRWDRRIGKYADPTSEGLPDLRALVEWCRARDIPTVFWNKEDPIHYERFKNAAQLFDHVLTTDANSVARYRSLVALRGRSIGVLPFAAQPTLHNPIALADPRLDRTCFAGTYYRNRHPERRAQLEMLLDAALPHGLVIYDRSFGEVSEVFGFPERFTPSIQGGMPYEQIVREYKRFKVFLNTNSVTDSPTMFSRRVYELLASGTPVVSTPSRGMRETFGDLVAIVDTPQSAGEAIRSLMTDERQWRSVSYGGVAVVMAGHTYAHRLTEIARVAGIDVDLFAGERIAALAPADDQVQLARIVDALARQRHAPSEVLIGTRGVQPGDGALDELRQLGAVVQVIAQDDVPDAPQRLRELAARATMPYLTVFDPRHRYDAGHLEELAACTRFARADVIGRASIVTTDGVALAPNLEHRYVAGVHPHAAIASRDVVSQRGWPHKWATMTEWSGDGVCIYSASRYGFRADPAFAIPADVQALLGALPAGGRAGVRLDDRLANDRR
jgi:hypothetical protein